MSDDPTRTCAGCGAEGTPDGFERFVWSPETGLLHDLRNKAPGRGAHVHAAPDCLKRAVQSGFNRSFKARVDAPTGDEFVRQVQQAVRTRLDETMRLAVRSQSAGVGSKGVDEQMKTNKASVAFVASDAGDATAKKYVANAERKGLTLVRAFDGATMGGWSGHDFVAVMTISGRLAKSAALDVESLVRLGCIEG